MAQALVESMSAEWDPKKYKDEYRDALMEVIEEKVESGGKEVEEKPKPKKPSGKVIDLVAVLQKSLAQSQGEGKKKRKTKAPARRAA
jgi:DNA end-binding protein Ku